jgi:hypothetical protein
MANKKSHGVQKTVFSGAKPSPKRYVPTPKEQIANLVMEDVAKGDIESGVNLLKKDLIKGNVEKDLEYMKREINCGYDIEDFIERGFW